MKEEHFPITQLVMTKTNLILFCFRHFSKGFKSTCCAIKILLNLCSFTLHRLKLLNRKKTPFFKIEFNLNRQCALKASTKWIFLPMHYDIPIYNALVFESTFARRHLLGNGFLAMLLQYIAKWFFSEYNSYYTSNLFTIQRLFVLFSFF